MPICQKCQGRGIVLIPCGGQTLGLDFCRECDGMGKVLTEDEKELLTEEVPPQVAGMLLCMLYGVIVGIAFGLLIGLNWK